MAATLRGPATGRFFSTFRTWSRLANFPHQRRRFHPANILHEAQNAHPERLTLLNRPATTNDALSGNHVAESVRLKTIVYAFPPEIVERIKEHPEFLRRVESYYNATVEVLDVVESGYHRVRITSHKRNLTRKIIKMLLSVRDLNAPFSSLDQPVQSTQDKTQGDIRVYTVTPHALNVVLEYPDFVQKVQDHYSCTIEPFGTFESGDGRLKITSPDYHTSLAVRAVLQSNRHLSQPPGFIDVQDFVDKVKTWIHTTMEKFELLKDNDQELLKRIEETFDVQLSLVLPTSARKPSLTITGGRRAATQARTFVDSLDVELAVGKVSGSKERYKGIMRSFPSGVVVLTTHSASPHSDGPSHIHGSLRGMTVSSLTSVTLEPEPIISLSIRRPSRTFDCITSGQHFFVHFLTDTSEAAKIANAFAKPHDDPLQPFRLLRDQRLAEPQDDEPFLEGPAIAARFECELFPEKSVEIGDHTVIFARVIDIYTSHKYRPQQIFLAYAQSQYKRLSGTAINTGPTVAGTDKPVVKQAAPVPETRQANAQVSETFTAEPTRSHDDAEIAEGPSASELAESAAAQEFNDRYWRMAMDENEKDVGDVLEERAADQRAVGEAETPAEATKDMDKI